MNSFFTDYSWATYGRKESSKEIWKKCQDETSRIRLFKEEIVFSWVMPVAEETGPESFLKTYESLKNQSYPFWELVVVFDEVDFVDSPLISEITQVKDKKVRIIKSESLFSDAAKKNFGFIKAVGNYVGVLNSGEILNPSLLFHFAVEIQKTASDLLYCNEVIEEEKSEKLFSKLEYSYLSLLNQNYVGRLWVLRKELIHSFDESCPALHEHLFLIHLARLNSNWRLVPIYGVRRIANESPKVSDHEYGKLLEGLNASGLTCHVLKNETDWNVLPDASVAVQAKVSVLVCFKDKADWTQKALENFKRFAGNVPFEAILINNQSKPSELQKLKDFLSTAEIAHKSLARANARSNIDVESVMAVRHVVTFYRSPRIQSKSTWIIMKKTHTDVPILLLEQ